MARTCSCGRCGFPVTKATALHSKHTGVWYCPDLDDCGRRSKNDLTLGEIKTMALAMMGTLV